MKSTIILSIMIMLCLKANSQSKGYAQFHVNSIGGGMAIGLEANKVALTIGMNHPMKSTENPTLYFFTTGYVMPITEVYNISFNGGGAYMKRKDFTKYDQGGEIEDIAKFIGIVNCEVGGNFNVGRAFVNIGYAEKIYFGVGIKCFF